MTANGVTGSSPHTRGARCRENSPTACGRDHPRIRGEHAREGQGEGGAEGIIPAYAGNTRPMPLSLYQLRGSSPHTRGAPHATSRGRHSAEDHPRIRGEHARRRDGDGHARGIIPAYAGSTHSGTSWYETWKGSSPHTRGARSPRASATAIRRDHPRIRGEHEKLLQSEADKRGIIPAYAGSTSMSRSCSTEPADHPRIRGEHARGVVLHDAEGGIIPAYAGSTGAPDWHVSDKAGSSPHTRGARRSPCR